MADDLTGKVWSLDTVVGVVTRDPVNVHSVILRFTTAGAGSFTMLTNISSSDSSNGKPFCSAKTVATSTANAEQLTQVFTYGDQEFQGLKKTLCVNVDSILVVTGRAR